MPDALNSDTTFDPTYNQISVAPCSPYIGAEIGRIDLTRPLSDGQVTELRRAFTDYLVVFFRDQEISFEDHVRLAEYFGPVSYTHLTLPTKRIV